MKKLPVTRPALFAVTTAAALLFSAASACATVVLQFSSSTVYASNWADSTGNGGGNLSWGVIIDTGDDGFETGYGPWQIDPSAAGSAQSLRDINGHISDDMLFLSSAAMASIVVANDGSTLGMNRILSIVGIPVDANSPINEQNHFQIVWFDQGLTSFSESQKYGLFSHPSFILPFDGGFETFTGVFAGADPLKPMTHTFVPEPASAGLLALAGLVLLRRRR